MIAAAFLFSAAVTEYSSFFNDVIEYEAEDQKTSGFVFGPDRTPGTVAAEASGRRAVWLKDSNQSIEFPLRAPARGLTLRYSLLSPANGPRQTSSAIVEVGGRKVTRVVLTSRYSGSSKPPEGMSSDRPVHHFWDEVRIMLPKSLPAGTAVSLRMAPQSKPFAVDLIDTTAIAPPTSAPRRAISVLRFGADPTGEHESRKPFMDAIAVASRAHRPVYMPPGRYRIDGHLIVDRLTIIGSGSWYSIIYGHHVGIYSRAGGSREVRLSGLAIESDVSKRQDRLALAAVGGRFSKSSFTDLYLHHAKVGMWLDGPARGLTIRNVEIADQTADGINLHRGIIHAVIENSRIRNVGDDGIASWSEGVPNERIRIRGNRATAIGLANGIAIYGGRDIEVTNNRIADTLTQGGGIHLGARFHSARFRGTIRIANNTIVRSGSFDPHWHFGVGAIWLYALEKPIDARIFVKNNRIDEPTCEAVQLLGPRPIRGLVIQGLQITGRVASVLALQTAGSLFAGGLVSDKTPVHPVVGVPRDDHLTIGAGNREWQTRSVVLSDPPRCTQAQSARTGFAA